MVLTTALPHPNVNPALALFEPDAIGPLADMRPNGISGRGLIFKYHPAKDFNTFTNEWMLEMPNGERMM